MSFYNSSTRTVDYFELNSSGIESYHRETPLIPKFMCHVYPGRTIVADHNTIQDLSTGSQYTCQFTIEGMCMIENIIVVLSGGDLYLLYPNIFTNPRTQPTKVHCPRVLAINQCPGSVNAGVAVMASGDVCKLHRNRVLMFSGMGKIEVSEPCAVVGMERTYDFPSVVWSYNEAHLVSNEHNNSYCFSDRTIVSCALAGDLSITVLFHDGSVVTIDCDGNETLLTGLHKQLTMVRANELVWVYSISEDRGITKVNASNDPLVGCFGKADMGNCPVLPERRMVKSARSSEE